MALSECSEQVIIAHSMNPKNSTIAQEWPLVILLLAPFITIAVLWPSLPARVPMHFDIRGNVNRYGSPWELLILPGINILVAVLLYFVPRLDPKQENIKQSLPTYRWIRFFVAAMLTYVFALMLVTTFHPTFDVAPLIAIGLLVLFFALGFAMPKLKQNYMIGIRLPWTLESEDNWNRTHAFAGRLWIRVSGAGIILAILFPTYSLYIAIGIIIILVAWTVGYSARLFQIEHRS